MSSLLSIDTDDDDLPLPLVQKCIAKKLFRHSAKFPLSSTETYMFDYIDTEAPSS